MRIFLNKYWYFHLIEKLEESVLDRGKDAPKQGGCSTDKFERLPATAAEVMKAKNVFRSSVLPAKIDNMKDKLEFKIDQFNREWVKVVLDRPKVNEINLDTSNYCFKQVGILEEFDTIKELINKFRNIEFKGDNIADEFAKFYELTKEIEIYVNKTNK